MHGIWVSLLCLLKPSQKCWAKRSVATSYTCPHQVTRCHGVRCLESKGQNVKVSNPGAVCWNGKWLDLTTLTFLSDTIPTSVSLRIPPSPSRGTVRKLCNWQHKWLYTRNCIQLANWNTARHSCSVWFILPHFVKPWIYKRQTEIMLWCSNKNDFLIWDKSN